jgi:hypothetical protein
MTRDIPKLGSMKRLYLLKTNLIPTPFPHQLMIATFTLPSNLSIKPTSQPVAGMIHPVVFLLLTLLLRTRELMNNGTNTIMKSITIQLLLVLIATVLETNFQFQFSGSGEDLQPETSQSCFTVSSKMLPSSKM